MSRIVRAHVCAESIKTGSIRKSIVISFKAGWHRIALLRRDFTECGCAASIEGYWASLDLGSRAIVMALESQDTATKIVMPY